MSSGPYPDVFPMRAHMPGCDADITRRGIVTTDRIGRIGNGGIVCHDYRCNREYAGCRAQVLVTERAVRLLAVVHEGEREVSDAG